MIASRKEGPVGALAALLFALVGCELRAGRMYEPPRELVEGPKSVSLPPMHAEPVGEAPPPELEWKEVDDTSRAERRIVRSGVPLTVLPRRAFPSATVLFVVGLEQKLAPGVAVAYASSAIAPHEPWAIGPVPMNGARRLIHALPDAVILEVTALSRVLVPVLSRLVPAFVTPPINPSSILGVRDYMEPQVARQTPSWRTSHLALLTRFFDPGHPYARPPEFFAASDIYAIKEETLVSFVSDTIGADNVAIVASGDVDIEALVGVLDESLAKIPLHAPVRSRTTAAPAPARPQRACTASAAPVPDAHAVVTFGYATVPASHADAPALEVLAAAAGSGLSSRFNGALRSELGATYGVRVASLAMRHAGVFEVRAMLAPSKTNEALAALERELERLRQTELEPEELVTAQLRAAHDRSRPNDAVAFATSQVLGARPIASLRDVTAADVRSVAERYLVPERRCVVTPATEPASK